MKKSVTVKGFRIHKDQKLIPYPMCNEFRVLLPGTLPPCSRTLACSLGSEHTREGPHHRALQPQPMPPESPRSKTTAHDKLRFCGTVFCSAGNSLLGENKDVYYFLSLTPQPGNPGMSAETMASVCSIVKTAAEAADVDFIKTKNC